MVLPAGLVLLRAAVVVDGEHDARRPRWPLRRGRSRTCRSRCRPPAPGPCEVRRAPCACRNAPSSSGMKPLAASACSSRSAGISVTVGSLRLAHRRARPSAHGMIGTRSSFRGGSARAHRDQRRPRRAGGRLRQVGGLARRDRGCAGGRGRPGGRVRRAVRAPSPRWGWPGSSYPRSSVGPAARSLDLAVALEAAASALVPGPLLGTAVASVALGELAGPVAAGEMQVALALVRRGGPRRTRSHPCPARSRATTWCWCPSRASSWPRAPRPT